MIFDNGYSPKNYGSHYYGSVTLHEALARSLNVPAVYLCGKANKDAWFVGYTSNYVTAIHVGFDQTDRTHYISTTGGSEPAKLFHDVMTQVYE